MENPLMLYLVTAAVAAALGYGIARLQDRFRLTIAQSRLGEITTQARREAENILKESELKAKDELFHKRTEGIRRKRDSDIQKFRPALQPFQVLLPAKRLALKDPHRFE